MPGFCRTVPTAEIKAAGYALTPGRYVGTAAVEDDGEPLDEKIERLTKELFEAMDESARLDAVVAAGGEGLMLHRADAPYVTGRSDALLKLKPRLDAEATVLAHLPGRGRLVGMMGALLVETPSGVRFQLGTGFTDAERREPPPVGAQVTYVYRELTRDGVPRFASYWRRREAF